MLNQLLRVQVFYDVVHISDLLGAVTTAVRVSY